MKRIQNCRAAAAAAGVIAVAGMLALIGTSRAGNDLAPGVTAGVSALTALPPQASVPPNVERFVRSAASATGTSPSAALLRVRMLRSGLGQERQSVYAFRSVSGSPCFLLVGAGGARSRNPGDGTPGLHWTIGGGTKETPSNLVGVAGDDVARVELVIDGARVPVSMKNNVIFAEFPSSAQEAEIVIHRTGGASNSVDIHMQG